MLALSAIQAEGGRVRRWVGDWVHVDTRNVHGDLSRVPGAVHRGIVGVVTAVSSGLGEQPLTVAGVSAALADHGLVASGGASGDSAWWEVPVAQLDAAVRVVHGQLVSAD
jgi:hypothetical protein